MAKTIIGKVGMTPKGTWNNETNYERLDTVTYKGCSYVAVEANIGIEPIAESEVWQLLADKGKTGDKGEKGKTGDKGEKGEKGDKPEKGVDYFTQEEKEDFKSVVVEGSKEEIKTIVVADTKTELNSHIEEKKTELDIYTSSKETSLKNELDKHTNTKKTELNTSKTELETEMSNTKDSLVQEIISAQNGFDTNAETKTTEFNTNAEEKLTEYNTNATNKTNTYDDNHTNKLTEYNNNVESKTNAFNENCTEKTNSYNTNASNKTEEFNNNAESYNKRITELEDDVTDLRKNSLLGIEEGEFITLNDCANARIENIEISGNSVQDGEPSIENPVDIKSSGDSGSINLVKANKNLLELKKGQTITLVGLTVNIEEDGTICLNGTIPDNNGFPEFLVSGNGEIKTLKGTPSLASKPDFYNSINLPTDNYKLTMIYLSGTTTSNLTHRPFVYLHTPSGQNLEFGQGIQGIKTKSYSGNIGGVSFYVNSGTTWNNFKFKLQITKDTENIDATEYIPHESKTFTIPVQQPMRSIGDVRDTFIKKDGKWYERHWIKNYVFNGSENWLCTKDVNNKTFQFNIPVINGNHFCTSMCNMFKHWKNNSWKDTGCFISYNSHFYVLITFNENEFTEDLTIDEALAKWKELISNTNLVVDYDIKEPIDLECTQEQSAILDNLEKTKTYKGITNIYSIDEISTINKVTYIKDLQPVIDGINNAITVLGGETNV